MLAASPADSGKVCRAGLLASRLKRPATSLTPAGLPSNPTQSHRMAEATVQRYGPLTSPEAKLDTAVSTLGMAEIERLQPSARQPRRSFFGRSVATPDFPPPAHELGRQDEERSEIRPSRQRRRDRDPGGDGPRAAQASSPWYMSALHRNVPAEPESRHGMPASDRRC